MVNPAGLPTSYAHGGRLTAPGTTADPILIEIVQATPLAPPPRPPLLPAFPPIWAGQPTTGNCAS